MRTKAGLLEVIREGYVLYKINIRIKSCWLVVMVNLKRIRRGIVLRRRSLHPTWREGIWDGHEDGSLERLFSFWDNSGTISVQIGA